MSRSLRAPHRDMWKMLKDKKKKPLQEDQPPLCSLKRTWHSRWNVTWPVTRSQRICGNQQSAVCSIRSKDVVWRSLFTIYTKPLRHNTTQDEWNMLAAWLAHVLQPVHTLTHRSGSPSLCVWRKKKNHFSDSLRIDVRTEPRLKVAVQKWTTSVGGQIALISRRDVDEKGQQKEVWNTLKQRRRKKKSKIGDQAALIAIFDLVQSDRRYRTCILCTQHQRWNDAALLTGQTKMAANRKSLPRWADNLVWNINL